MTTNPNRWGVLWPDTSYTGPIAQYARDLTTYAKSDGGRVYEIGGAEDPERMTNTEAITA